jgi:hypothetical protein
VGEWEAWKRVPVRVRAQIVVGLVCFFVGRIIIVNEAGRRAELGRASAPDRIKYITWLVSYRAGTNACCVCVYSRLHRGYSSRA